MRFSSVNYIKAAAIIAVVMSHAVLPVWDPRFTAVDLALGAKWTAYHVPSFLALSGFLYWSGEPIALATVGRRMLRQPTRFARSVHPASPPPRHGVRCHYLIKALPSAFPSIGHSGQTDA